MRGKVRLAAVSVVLVLAARGVGAQGSLPLTDAEVAARLDFIQGSLDRGRAAADVWWNGWLAGYGAATLGQVAAYAETDSEKSKQDMRVGAATTALGAIGQLVFPLDAGRLAVRLRAILGDTPEARRAKLAAAEAFLRRSAAQEELGRSWQAHAVAGAVNVAAGLVIWKHYKRPARDGLAAFAVGELISEIQIFTQPTRAIRDRREYESRSSFAPPGAAAGPRRAWYVGVTPGKFVVGCRF
ncbi:MAG TPA: hypothetical protein VMT19_09535 [Thermoanaerobaculaceae bacterium]|nr:hypothetical protein [Thermoanaerobaculaceae bacterium]